MVNAEFVKQVRLDVLQEAWRTGRVPDAAAVARHLGHSAGDVVEAFRRLAESHVYVLEPGDPTRLRMANPFSAMPTPFTVEVAGVQYFGNCVWDALGVVSLLGGEGRVRTSCPDCQEQMILDVSGRHMAPIEAVVHFAVPGGGGTTSSTPEEQCCSSVPRSTSGELGSRAVLSLPRGRCGGWLTPGIRTAPTRPGAESQPRRRRRSSPRSA